MSYRIATLITLIINKYSVLELFISKTHLVLIRHFIFLKADFFSSLWFAAKMACTLDYFIQFCFIYQDLNIRKPPLLKEKVLFIHNYSKVTHIWVQVYLVLLGSWFLFVEFLIFVCVCFLEQRCFLKFYGNAQLR